MDPLRNPYMPGAGAQPPELTGRADILDRARVMLGRARRHRVSKAFVAYGLRGVGKTVLLNQVRQMAVEAGDRVCFVEAHEQKSLPALLVPQLRRVLLELDRLGALSEQVKRSLRVLKSFMSAVKVTYGDAELSLDIQAETGTADSGDVEADLPDLLAAVGTAAAARDAAVVVLVDELQYLTERDMSALIMGFHRTVQEGLPFLLAGAGLPQVLALSGRPKSYAERLFDFVPVDALSPVEAARALEAPAQDEDAAWTSDALAEAIQITRGYPYFLQEWGYHAWNEALSSPIQAADVTAAGRRALKQLDNSFFRVRFDRLTPRERDYLRAMADLGPGPHRSSAVASRLGLSVQQAAPLRDGLIARGMAYSPAHGDLAFTVPLFDEFLLRTLPDWHPDPPRRKRDRPA
jgi:hypothetical protein